MVQVKFYCVACNGTKYRSDKNVYYTSRKNPVLNMKTWMLVSDCGKCKHELWKIVGPGPNWQASAKRIAKNKHWIRYKNKRT